MKVSIEVKDRQEAAAVRAAMDDAEVRAFVLIVGTLLPLSEGGRRRVLQFVSDQVAEERALGRIGVRGVARGGIADGVL
jgi:hypothetical protein